MDKIGLHIVDSLDRNFAMMKIYSYHKQKGDLVELYNSIFHLTYDKIYASKIFTYTDNSSINSNMIIGGSGISLKKNLPEEIESCEPDYSLYPKNNQALGFITRGCICNCEYCLVPKKEGNIKPYRDIEQISQGRKEVILYDNNILASGYGIKQIEKIIKLGLKVDFNQGLDARLIDNSIAKLLSKVKWLKPLRLSCDNVSMINTVRKAVELLRWNNVTPRRYSIYLLIDDIDSAVERLKFIKGMNLDPFAQAYRDCKGTAPKKEWIKFERYVNMKAVLNSTVWENYKYINHSKI